MTQEELLLELMQRLDQPAARHNELDLYYTGRQPLAFLSPEAKVALGNRFGVMASNIPRLAVTALAERLRNTDRILGDYGCSEIDDLKPLVDALKRASPT